YNVYKAIARGKPDPRWDNLPEKILQALWIVLAQKSVFKTRPIVSFLHALVFYGFVFYFLVNLVDVLEGFFFFKARGGAWCVFSVSGLGAVLGVSFIFWVMFPRLDCEWAPRVLFFPPVWCTRRPLPFPPMFRCNPTPQRRFSVIPPLWRLSYCFMWAAVSC